MVITCWFLEYLFKLHTFYITMTPRIDKMVYAKCTNIFQLARIYLFLLRVLWVFFHYFFSSLNSFILYPCFWVKWSLAQLHSIPFHLKFGFISRATVFWMNSFIRRLYCDVVCLKISRIYRWNLLGNTFTQNVNTL